MQKKNKTKQKRDREVRNLHVQTRSVQTNYIFVAFQWLKYMSNQIFLAPENMVFLLQQVQDARILGVTYATVIVKFYFFLLKKSEIRTTHLLCKNLQLYQLLEVCVFLFNYCNIIIGQQKIDELSSGRLTEEDQDRILKEIQETIKVGFSFAKE